MRCSQCKEEKPETCFHFHNKAANRRLAMCIPCRKFVRKNPLPKRVLPAGHKRCSICKAIKPVAGFSAGNPRCRQCNGIYMQNYRQRPGVIAEARTLTAKRRRILNALRSRCTRDKVPFNLTIDDIQIPEFCPVLGVRLVLDAHTLSTCSPSLDRLIGSLGYVKGNVRVMSHRANTLISNGTLEEHEKVVAFLRTQVVK